MSASPSRMARCTNPYACVSRNRVCKRRNKNAPFLVFFVFSGNLLFLPGRSCRRSFALSTHGMHVALKLQVWRQINLSKVEQNLAGKCLRVDHNERLIRSLILAEKGSHSIFPNKDLDSVHFVHETNFVNLRRRSLFLQKKKLLSKTRRRLVSETAMISRTKKDGVIARRMKLCTE